MDNYNKSKHAIVILPPSPPPYADGIIEKLSAAGFLVESMDWNSVGDLSLEPSCIDLLILTKARDVPAFLQNRVRDYLKLGGRFISLGGPPFENEYYSVNNREIPLSRLSHKLSEGEFDKTPLFDMENPSTINSFRKDVWNPDNKQVIGDASISLKAEGTTGNLCLCYSVDNFYINESFEAPISPPSGHNALGFWLRADENTHTVSISLTDKNGNMFKTRVTPSVEYQYFMLTKRDFTYVGNNQERSAPAPAGIDISEATLICIGHALSHAYSTAGGHRFLIDDISTGKIALLNDEQVIIDGLYPPYKFYPITNAVRIVSSASQSILPPAEYELTDSLFSLSPRPQASGTNKGRRFRFIPLIEAYDDKSFRCGYAGYIMLNYSYGQLSSDVEGSAIGVFTPSDDLFYQNGGEDAVIATALALTAPVLLIEGGADEYIYLPDQAPICGAAVLVREQVDLSEYLITIIAGVQTITCTADELSVVKSQENWEIRGVTTDFSSFTGEVTVTLTKDGQVIDSICHSIEIYTAKPIEECHFAQIQAGQNEVHINGSPVRFFGVNYMPSSNIGIDVFPEFEHYVSSYAYDPEVIENDIRKIAEVGLNAVSIFFYYDPSIVSNNILHLVELCRKHGLYVTLSLRPHANPFDFNKAELEEMISRYHFNENDNIVGYDIAWERYVGTYEPCYGNFAGRKSFDRAFNRYLLQYFGSYDAAEKLTGCILPRDEQGNVIGLSDDQLRVDGQHTPLVAFYRRCIDHEVIRAHVAARDFIKSIDPNHLITARSGDASGIPLVDPGVYGYDFTSLVPALDFFSPESYALSDEATSMRQGIFTNLYARYANADAVIQWMEFGKSVWTGSNFIDNHSSLEAQAEYFKGFFDMLLAGHTAGLYAWWWAGGYRVLEQSDFGTINPDGSDRPVTCVFRDYARRFINAPLLAKPSTFFSIDRDLHSDGIRSVYRSLEESIFSAISQGKAIALVDEGMGRTSENVPLTQTGQITEAEISPKYLDSVLLSCTAILGDGSRHILQSGDTLLVGKSSAINISLEWMNCQTATWIFGDTQGSVSLQSLEGSFHAFSLPLYSDVSRHGRVSFHLTVPCDAAGDTSVLACRLYAKSRTFFGDPFYLTLNTN